MLRFHWQKRRNLHRSHNPQARTYWGNTGSWAEKGQNKLANSTARGYVSNWDLPTKKLIIRNIKGSFSSNVLVKGVDSGAQWLMLTNNPQENANDAFEENVLLETEADNILDWTETNPFGTIDENY